MQPSPAHRPRRRSTTCQSCVLLVRQGRRSSLQSGQSFHIRRKPRCRHHSRILLRGCRPSASTSQLPDRLAIRRELRVLICLGGTDQRQPWRWHQARHLVSHLPARSGILQSIPPFTEVDRRRARQEHHLRRSRLQLFDPFLQLQQEQQHYHLHCPLLLLP